MKVKFTLIIISAISGDDITWLTLSRDEFNRRFLTEGWLIPVTFYARKTPLRATLGDCVGSLQDKITVSWRLSHPVILLDRKVADVV